MLIIVCLPNGAGDAVLYSGVIEYGLGLKLATPPFSSDRFESVTGTKLIDESQNLATQPLFQTEDNPTYEVRQKLDKVKMDGGQILMEGVFAHDGFALAAL